jgi:peptidoglycan hydrolase-like protein with peptidoglycan-binding domain
VRRRLAFICVLLLFSSASAFAQNVNDIINTIRGLAQRGLAQQGMIQSAQLEWSMLSPTESACIDRALGQQGKSIVDLINHGLLPTDPGLSQLRSNCSVQVGQQSVPAPISSSTPTFDCAKAKTPVEKILCIGGDGARADWTLNASEWAYSASLDGDARKVFSKSEDDWLESLNATCNLTFELSQTQRLCVIDAYQRQSKLLQSKISPDALAEAALSPEQRAAIQGQLISLGFLNDQADAQFGPKTREAIKTFQGSNGHVAANYLTGMERQMLLSRPTQIGTNVTSPTITPLSDDRAKIIADLTTTNEELKRDVEAARRATDDSSQRAAAAEAAKLVAEEQVKRLAAEMAATKLAANQAEAAKRVADDEVKHLTADVAAAKLAADQVHQKLTTLILISSIGFVLLVALVTVTIVRVRNRKPAVNPVVADSLTKESGERRHGLDPTVQNVGGRDGISAKIEETKGRDAAPQSSPPKAMADKVTGRAPVDMALAERATVDEGSPAETIDAIDQLAKFAELHANGTLTNEEFSKLKNNLIGLHPVPQTPS